MDDSVAAQHGVASDKAPVDPGSVSGKRRSVRVQVARSPRAVGILLECGGEWALQLNPRYVRATRGPSGRETEKPAAKERRWRRDSLLERPSAVIIGGAMAWHRSIGPTEILRSFCSALGVASLGYDASFFFLFDFAPDELRLIGGVALICTGWLPFLASGTRRRLVVTMVAGLAASVLSQLWFGMPMHDLSTEWLDHDRWCFPTDDRIITSSTVTLMLFAPLVLWAAWRLVRTETGARTLRQPTGAP